METVKDAYDFGFVSLSVGYDEEGLEGALEQNYMLLVRAWIRICLYSKTERDYRRC